MKVPIAILYNILEEDKCQKDERYKDVLEIEKTLQEVGYKVEKIGVDSNVDKLMLRLKETSPKYVFNLCEEIDNDSWGEIYVAGLLELLRIPYTGSGPFCLALSLNKARSKDILQSNGVPVPKYQVFDSEKTKIREDLNFPLIVKPLCEDGSFGIEPNSVVINEDELYERILARKNEFRESVIVEEYIEGREMNVAILGNGKEIRALPISEIDYSTLPSTSAKICTYNAKWEKDSIEYKGTVPVCPTNISSNLKMKLEEIAFKVYSVMNCTDYARVDFRISKDGIPYVIDINPNPCISPDSGFVRSAKAEGMQYKDFIIEIFRSCQKRYHNGDKDKPR